MKKKDIVIIISSSCMLLFFVLFQQFELGIFDVAFDFERFFHALFLAMLPLIIVLLFWLKNSRVLLLLLVLITACLSIFNTLVICTVFPMLLCVWFLQLQPWNHRFGLALPYYLGSALSWCMGIILLLHKQKEGLAIQNEVTLQICVLSSLTVIFVVFLLFSIMENKAAKRKQSVLAKGNKQKGKKKGSVLNYVTSIYFVEFISLLLRVWYWVKSSSSEYLLWASLTMTLFFVPFLICKLYAIQNPRKDIKKMIEELI